MLDRKQRKIVYTNFRDELVGVRAESLIELPAMTGAQYEKKVRDYLSDLALSTAIRGTCCRRNEVFDEPVSD